MKNKVKYGLRALMAVMTVLAFISCPDSPGEEPELTLLRIGNPTGGNATAVLGDSGSTPDEAVAGRITLRVFPEGELVVNSPAITPGSKGTVQYAVTAGAAPEAFSDAVDKLEDGDCLWVEVTLNGKARYYKINVTVTNAPIPDEIDPFYGQITGRPKLSFNMNNMPTPAQWNSAGDMYEYPNPFIRMNGNDITDPLDWEAYEDENGVKHRRPLDNKIPEGWTLVPGGRRAEIKKIAEYYHQGEMPPPPDSIEISGDGNTAAGGSTTLTVSYGDKTATITATLTMPSVAPNGKAPSPENKVPIFLGVGSGGLTELRANGWATLNMSQGADNSGGAVQTLFAPSGADRPSNLMRIAWEASRWMDAAEMGAWGDCVDASKSAVSGVSRNGKAAMMTGAFAESQKGTRIAISVPASSGGGGANMERWTHQKQGLGRREAGYTQFGLMYLKNYAMTGSGSYTGASPYIAVKIPPKEWEAKADMVARRTQIQALASIRTESSGGWVGDRMTQFTPQRTNFNIQGSSGGILSTMPMDTHFIAALSAPNIWMGADGWGANALGNPPSGDSGWVSQEPVYMTYLATREVYDFLGVEQNCGIILTMSGHAWPSNQVYAMIDYANWFFNTYHHPDAAADDMYRRQSGEDAQPVHDIDVFTDRLKDNDGNPIPYCTWYNPMAREDYLRLNWKNPNRIRRLPNEYTGDNVTAGRSIAANVRAYFRRNPGELVDLEGNPATLDYSSSMVPEGN